MSAIAQLKSKQFVIFSFHRTGSSMLVDILDSIPEIKCYYELYKPKTDYTENELLVKTKTTPQNWKIKAKNDPLSYWKEIINLQCNNTFSAIGFKIFWGHHQSWLEYLANSSDFEKIVLLRNPIARYISAERAKVTGKWFQLKSEETTKKLIFNPVVFDRFVKTHNNGVQYYLEKTKNYPDKYLTVTYENIVNRTALRSILEKLQLDSTQVNNLKTKYVKQTVEPIEKCFLNYEQMKEYILQNYSELLDDPEAPQFN
jgi:hypothetical protein